MPKTSSLPFLPVLALTLLLAGCGGDGDDGGGGGTPLPTATSVQFVDPSSDFNGVATPLEGVVTSAASGDATMLRAETDTRSLVVTVPTAATVAGRTVRFGIGAADASATYSSQDGFFRRYWVASSGALTVLAVTPTRVIVRLNEPGFVPELGTIDSVGTFRLTGALVGTVATPE